MNTTGDDEEELELLAQGLPLSAPVAADMGQSRTEPSYTSRPAVPVTRWPARAAANDLPPGHPYAAHPTPASVPAPASAPTPADPAPSEPVLHGPAPRTPVPSTPMPSTPAPWDRAPSEPVPGDQAPSVPAPAEEPPVRAARDGHVAAVGRSGDERAPEPPAHADYLFTGGSPGEPPDDPNRVILRKQLDALRARAASAASWQEASAHYAQLVNSDGVVPVTARFTRDDIEFLGRAREEVLGLAELGLRLLELHAPLDAGGISTDPSSPIMRCRSCMWRWPCPTFSVLSETVNQLPHPRSPLAR
jgi:hypothetical protein